jgi:hypothetical protein
MNKFACRKKIPIDIFLIFCHDILAMILFRILAKSKGVHVLILFIYRTKTVHFITHSPVALPFHPIQGKRRERPPDV